MTEPREADALLVAIENVARTVALRVLGWSRFSSGAARSALVAVGRCGRGAAALAAARHLSNYDIPVRVIVCGPGEKLSDPARRQRDILTKMDVRADEYVSLESLEREVRGLGEAQCLVDGSSGMEAEGKEAIFSRAAGAETGAGLVVRVVEPAGFAPPRPTPGDALFEPDTAPRGRNEARMADSLAIESFGIPGLALMENAGWRVAREAYAMLGFEPKGRVAALCGTGNNGGDGFVAARHLRGWGVDAEIVLVGARAKLLDDAAANLDLAEAAGVKVREASEPEILDALLAGVLRQGAERPLVIDALLGTGLYGKVRGLYGNALAALERARPRLLAVDIPSGLDANTGEVLGVASTAERTVTFGFPKTGFALARGPERVGEVTVADISLPRRLWHAAGDGERSAAVPAGSAGERAFRARWALLPGGKLAEHVRVEIAGGGIRRVRIDEPGGAEGDVDLGNVLLLPGLVNAHTHLELYSLDAPILARGFGWWLAKVGLRRALMAPGRIVRRAREAAMRMRAEGVAYVGEVTTLGLSCKALLDGGLGGTLYSETAGRRGGTASAMRETLRTLPRTALAAGLAPGIFPHAPYSTCAGRYAAAAMLGRSAGFRLATHAAESPAEATLFRDGAGGLRAAARLAGVRPPKDGATSVQWLDRIGFLRQGVALVHCNVLSAGDARLIADRGASVVVCPSSAAHFGHGPPRLGPLAEAGVSFAVGTDSPASGGGTSLWRELVRLRRLEPDLDPRALLMAATEGGARAIGLPAERIGIRAGAPARLASIAVAAGSRDPLRDALAEGARSVRVV